MIKVCFLLHKEEIKNQITIDEDHLDWKLRSEKLEDGIEERVPYGPR